MLREQLYIERIDQVETQLSEVRGGRSQEYLGPLQSLLDTMNSRKEVADILKKYRLENIRNKYECEKQAAGQHFEVSNYKSKSILKIILIISRFRVKNFWP